MRKKTMYRLLAFIIFTFALLGVVVRVELNRYSDRTEEQANNGPQSTNDQGNTAKGSGSGAGGAGLEEASTKEADSDSASPSLPADNTQEDTGPWEDIVLLFTGDIYLSDYILNKYNQNGIDGILSEDLQKEFTGADIAMVNQEFAFTGGGTPARDKQFTFRVDPKNVQIFNDMQVDMVSLANNHSMDFGIEGLTDSFDTLKNAGIQYVGAGHNITEAREIKYVDIKDKKIAYLGASRVIPETGWNAGADKPGMLTTYDPALLIEDIKTAEQESDYVIVYVHWGIERHETPESYQRSLAKQYIDAGADLVVGSHPHVLQGIEYYNGKPVIYSLGNFMFYNSIKQTAVLKVTLNEQSEADIRLLPVKSDNASAYLPDEESKRSEFYRHMEDISFDITFDGEGGVIR